MRGHLRPNGWGNVVLVATYKGERYGINMRQSMYINETTVKGMDIMKVMCVMMVIVKRQDSLVDDRLCSKENRQKYKI